MKRIALFLFILAVTAPSFAQRNRQYSPRTFYFFKEVPVQAYEGKAFRFEIAVKAFPADSLSGVRIEGRATGSDRSQVALTNPFTVETRDEQGWTVYTVIGNITPGTRQLRFYHIVTGRGDFYFDDVNCYIEDRPGHWIQLQLFNHSFEETQPDVLTGYYTSGRPPANLITQPSTDIFKSGHQSLEIRINGLRSSDANLTKR